MAKKLSQKNIDDGFEEFLNVLDSHNVVVICKELGLNVKVKMCKNGMSDPNSKKKNIRTNILPPIKLYLRMLLFKTKRVINSFYY
jgi:hypothetical protein